MAAAVYARYSSENQRPESIDDQISECRKVAGQRSIVISDDHIFSDQAQSGARSDRPALAALTAAAQRDEFDVVFVDDLSRRARDNHLKLSIIAERSSSGIRSSPLQTAWTATMRSPRSRSKSGASSTSFSSGP